MATSNEEEKIREETGAYLQNPKIQKLYKLGEKDPEFLKKLNNMKNSGKLKSYKDKKLDSFYKKSIKNMPSSLTTIKESEWKAAVPERIDDLLKKNKPGTIKKPGKDKLLKQDGSRGTPLHHAVEYFAPLDIIKKMYEASKDSLKVRKKMSRETVLHRAAYLNRTDIIPFILKEWPDSVQVKNERVETPYDVAESRKNNEAMVLLKEVTENNISGIENELNDLHKQIKEKKGYDVFIKFAKKMIDNSGGIKKEKFQEMMNIITTLQKFENGSDKGGGDEEKKEIYETRKKMFLYILDKLEEMKIMTKTMKKFGKQKYDRILNEFTRDRGKKRKEKRDKKGSKFLNKEMAKLKKTAKANKAVAAMKRYMNRKPKTKKKKDKKEEEKKEEGKKEELSEEEKERLIKIEKGRELFELTKTEFGIQSKQYLEVQKHVLAPTKKTRKALNPIFIDKFKDKTRKKRAIELLDKYDKWLQSRKPKPKKNEMDEELQKMTAKSRAELGISSSASSSASSSSSSSFGSSFKGDEFTRKIVGIFKKAGLTGLEIGRIITKNGLQISKNVITPIHHSITKNRKRHIKRRKTRRVYDKIMKNLYKPKNEYDKGYKDAMKEIKKQRYKEGYKKAINILKDKEYQQGYEDAMRKINMHKGGLRNKKKTRMYKKRKSNKKTRKRRY